MIDHDKAKLKQLQEELIRVKAERDTYCSLILEAMRKSAHSAPMRIDQLDNRHWFPVADDAKVPNGW